MAAAIALAQSGFDVELFESRAYLGGRASSFPLSDSEHIDNCQHVLLACCTNLVDFYRRLGAESQIRFHSEFYFLEPGGKLSTLRPGLMGFLGFGCLAFKEKLAVLRALLALRAQQHRTDLDSFTMLDWLREQRQPERAIRRFWGQILVSAVNEELDQMAASHGFQVFLTAFFGAPEASHMGVPAVPLSQLYSAQAWSRLPHATLRFRTPVDRIENSTVEAGGRGYQGDAVICALPFERAGQVAPQLELDFSGWRHSPITGIHLWFDRAVTKLPHATLVDRTIQWFFNKSEGRQLQLVVSASRSLTELPRQQVIDLALGELAEFLPEAGSAKLEMAHVVKEVRATFSAVPGLEAMRPLQTTAIDNLFLAGDWTRTGWPATMEGAVRSGYLAAEAAAASLGRPARYLIP